jgi:hypothetical protein
VAGHGESGSATRTGSRPCAVPTRAVALRAAMSANADLYAQNLAQGVADVQASGATSLRATAKELHAWNDDTAKWAVAGIECAESVEANRSERFNSELNI